MPQYRGIHVLFIELCFDWLTYIYMYANNDISAGWFHSHVSPVKSDT